MHGISSLISPDLEGKRFLLFVGLCEQSRSVASVEIIYLD